MNWLRILSCGLLVKPQFGFLNACPRLKRYHIGEWTHGHYGLQVLSPEGGMLRIGNFSSIARGVTIMLGGEHRKDWLTTFAFPALMAGPEPYGSAYGLSKGDVNIGNDVWIGVNATILSGVTLADGMVVGAGSVVRRSFPAYSIVAGNPASLVGYRFPKDIVEDLLRIRWWDWPVERIREALPLLLSNNACAFVQRYGQKETD